MKDLVYPHERTLGTITLILGLLVWTLLIVGTLGTALILLAIGFVGYVFAQSALIARIQGNGVELTRDQFPDLYGQFIDCCDRLEIKDKPRVYVLEDGGGLNAFATQFLGAKFVVLLSDIVDAMEEHDDGVRFYIGHELGHIRRKHLTSALLRWPALWLPLVGAAYARACESTCDRHGLACSDSREGAARALAALSAGSRRWKNIDLQSFSQQAQQTTGFWASFHELVSSYPWLTKRAVRMLQDDSSTPRRNPLAYLPALFVPNVGRISAGPGVLGIVFVVGILAAIAIPAYQDYLVKVELTRAFEESRPVLGALAQYYESNEDIPPSLSAINAPTQLPDGSPMSLDPDYMVLTVATSHGLLLFEPTLNQQGRVVWQCKNGEGLKAVQLPSSCAGP